MSRRLAAPAWTYARSYQQCPWRGAARSPLPARSHYHHAVGHLGIWECQPGGWPVVDRPDTEFTYILSGRANLTDDASGEVVEIGAGDLVILPPGWTGRWDIIEPVRKVYAIY